MQKNDFLELSNKELSEINHNKMSRKQFIFTLISYFSYTSFEKELQTYGIECSFKHLIKPTFLILLFVFFAGYFCHLQISYLLFLLVFVTLLLPLYFKTKYQQLYEIQRFEMVASYIENVIPIFESKPVIVYALKEVSDLLEGAMKQCVEKAVDCILDTSELEKIYDEAFEIIEKEFPNSRIKATHQMMKTIEILNSKEYSAMVMNLFMDIQSWISRTYFMQKEMHNRKVKLLILTLLTMGSSSFFVGVFTSNDMFVSYINAPFYQIGTLIFLMANIILFMIFHVSINNKWMVNDDSIKNKKSFIKAFQNSVLIMKKTNRKIHWIIALFIMSIGGIYAFYRNNYFVLLLSILITYLCLNADKRQNKKNKEKVRKALQIEFPLWLRDVCLHLHHHTVTNAIRKSQEQASVILKYYLYDLLRKVEDNPISITPYDEFLEEYDLPDVKADLKILYALSKHSHRQMEKEISALIYRNQEMLAKAERLQNEDFIMIMGRLGFLPVLLFISNMLLNMGLLFTYLIDFMNKAIQF